MRESRKRAVVFISWSGEVAKALATELQATLRVCLDADIFMSEEDIDSGEMWRGRIDGELAAADFGISVVTPDNQTSPWLVYEAGALAKVVEEPGRKGAPGRLCPWLVGMKPSELSGPLSAFHAREANKDGTEKMVLDIARFVDTDPEIVRLRLEGRRDSLGKALKTAKAALTRQARKTDEAPPDPAELRHADLLRRLEFIVKQFARLEAAFVSSPLTREQKILNAILERMDPAARKVIRMRYGIAEPSPEEAALLLERIKDDIRSAMESGRLSGEADEDEDEDEDEEE